MDQLLKSLDNQFKKANKQIKEIKQTTTPEEVNMMGCSSSSMPATYSHVERYGPQVSFSKASRFTEKEKDKLVDSFSPSPCSYLLPPQTSIGTLPPTYRFSTTTRFSEPQTDYTCYSVDYSQSSKEKPVKGGYFAKAGESQLTDEVETQWNESEVGPGPAGYAVNFSLVEKASVVGQWAREQRWKQEEIKDQEVPRDVNYDAVKRKAPAVLIKEKTKKNEKQLKKIQEEEIQKEIVAKAYKEKNLTDIDAAIRPHEPVAMIIDRDKNKSFKERIRLLVALIEKNRRERILGPGRYELIQEKKQKDYKFGVVYRQTSVEIRRIKKEKKPGPQTYEVSDKLIRDNTKNIIFNKEERYKRQKTITLEALDLHYSIGFLIKNQNKIVNSKIKRVKGLYFGKEKESQAKLTEAAIINERADLQRGPQTYEPYFKLTEKRNDIGIIKQKEFGEVEENNYRENIMEKYMVNEDVGDPGGEVPVTTLTKPQHNAAYAYHQPTDHHSEHIPDTVLFPEHWRFYEKDEGRLTELAGKLFQNKQEFEVHEDEMNELKWLLNKWRKQPEVGKYEPKEIEGHVAQIDFEKFKGRDVIEEEPGEELILSPEKPSKHIMVRKFSQMLGRDENLSEKDELIIDKDYNQLEKKVPGMVEMARQLGRKEDDNEEQEVVNIEPNYELVQEKCKGVEFWKMTGRDFELKEGDEEVNIDVGPAKDKIKQKKEAGVFMDKGGERFPEEKIDPIQGETTEQRINYDQAVNAVKPRAVGMQSFGKTAKKDFRIVEKKKKIVSVQEEKDNEDETFEKYQEDKELNKYQTKTDLKNSNNNNRKKVTKKQEKNVPQKQEKLINSMGPWNNPSNINNP